MVYVCLSSFVLPKTERIRACLQVTYALRTSSALNISDAFTPIKYLKVEPSPDRPATNVLQTFACHQRGCTRLKP